MYKSVGRVEPSLAKLSGSAHVNIALNFKRIYYRVVDFLNEQMITVEFGQVLIINY